MIVFAPHIAEELWQKFEKSETIADADYPAHDDKYLVEATVNYPVAINGKTRFTLELPADASKEEIEKAAVNDERIAKYIEGVQIRKVIVVPKRMVNVVAK